MIHPTDLHQKHDEIFPFTWGKHADDTGTCLSRGAHPGAGCPQRRERQRCRASNKPNLDAASPRRTWDRIAKGDSFRSSEVDPETDRGMVLPFDPVVMTFQDVHYWVNCPPVSPHHFLKFARSQSIDACFFIVSACNCRLVHLAADKQAPIMLAQLMHAASACCWLVLPEAQNTRLMHHLAHPSTNAPHAPCKAEPNSTSSVVAPAVSASADGGTRYSFVLFPILTVLLWQDLDQSKANVNEKGGKPMLELLRGISGAFRPGFMTCLMGVSGAGTPPCPAFIHPSSADLWNALLSFFHSNLLTSSVVSYCNLKCVPHFMH